MTLNQQLITQLQDELTKNYLSEMPNTENTSIKLVNQQCWSKITYFFGQKGPEIMFFCKQDPITKQFMPDLEPVKIYLRQFDSGLNEL